MSCEGKQRVCSQAFMRVMVHSLLKHYRIHHRTQLGKVELVCRREPYHEVTSQPQRDSASLRQAVFY